MRLDAQGGGAIAFGYTGFGMHCGAPVLVDNKASGDICMVTFDGYGCFWDPRFFLVARRAEFLCGDASGAGVGTAARGDFDCRATVT